MRCRVKVKVEALALRNVNETVLSTETYAII